MKPARLAVVGAGLIGKRHIEHVIAEPEAALADIVDPSSQAKAMAEALGVAWAPDFAHLVTRDRPDGVIIATPNQMHVENGLEAIGAGVALLVEKPIADDVASGTRLVEASERAGVPLLVGHHRRHNPMIQKARAIIASGRLGAVVSVHAMCWFHKPEDYFDVAWRRQKGAGPVFLNLIHDIDNLRYLCGDVVAVQAFESNALRGNPVEESCVVVLRFAGGAIGTVNVSDAIVAPWSWELTTGENPVYPHIEEPCYFFGGTHGSLTVPYLDVWSNPGKRSWWEPIDAMRESYVAVDPLVAQISNFCRVIRGEEPPVVSGREGLATLKVILAVKEAAASGRMVGLA